MRMRSSCARRSFSSASRSSRLRCSSTSVRRRTSRSRSMFSDSVERSLSRSARRISSNANVSRPISSASPAGGTGRASSPRAISSARCSERADGRHHVAHDEHRPAPATSAQRQRRRAQHGPSALARRQHEQQHEPRREDRHARKNSTSFARSVMAERTSATGSRWRAPSCPSSGRSSRAAGGSRRAPWPATISALAPSRRPAVAASNPHERRPMTTTATTPNAQASACDPARRYGSTCAARNAATASGSSRAGARRAAHRRPGSVRWAGCAGPATAYQSPIGTTSAGTVSASSVPGLRGGQLREHGDQRRVDGVRDGQQRGGRLAQAAPVAGGELAQRIEVREARRGARGRGCRSHSDARAAAAAPPA